MEGAEAEDKDEGDEDERKATINDMLQYLARRAVYIPCSDCGE
jgi:hypothetical protein